MRTFMTLFIALSLVGCASKTPYNAPAQSESVSKIQMVRPADPMTLTQGVEIEINNKYVDKLWHTSELVTYAKYGDHNLTTSVGVSLGFPNVTGFNGAKEFNKVFNFSKPNHFFKVEFSPGLLAGQHIIYEITEKEFKTLTN